MGSRTKKRMPIGFMYSEERGFSNRLLPSDRLRSPIDIPKSPLVVGTPENRLKITIEGRNILSSACKYLTSKDSEERMWAGITLLQIVNRDGHICTFLRESGDSSARAFRETLNKAFSIGDMELNVDLKKIRRQVFTPPKPRHCMIIPVEELEAQMKKHGEPETSNRLSPNETFYAYCRKMFSLSLGPGFAPAPRADGSVDPDVSEKEVLEAIQNLDMEDSELEYGLRKMAETSIHDTVREAVRAKLEPGPPKESTSENRSTSKSRAELLREFGGSLEGPFREPPSVILANFDETLERKEAMDSEELNIAVRKIANKDSHIENPIDKLNLVLQVMGRQNEIRTSEDLQRVYDEEVQQYLKE